MFRIFKKRYVFIILSLVLAGTGIFMLERKPEHASFSDTILSIKNNLLGGLLHSTEDEPEQSPNNSEFEIDGTVIVQTSREGWLLYNDSTYPFSFEFPAHLKPKGYADEAGDIIVFEDEGNAANAFQVFVTSFGEEVDILSAERIHTDIPDMIMEDPKEAILGDGSHALIFLSQDSVLGKTREVWIIHQMMLYQITARMEVDSVLAEVMKTWRFR